MTNTAQARRPPAWAPGLAGLLLDHHDVGRAFDRHGGAVVEQFERRVDRSGVEPPFAVDRQVRLSPTVAIRPSRSSVTSPAVLLDPSSPVSAYVKCSVPSGSR
ncbi:hypothetical protein NKG94_32775 [Micromonospora sp. M12]